MESSYSNASVTLVWSGKTTESENGSDDNDVRDKVHGNKCSLDIIPPSRLAIKALDMIYRLVNT